MLDMQTDLEGNHQVQRSEVIYNQIQDILEINRMIVKQNALLVQTLTIPKLMASGERPGSWTEYGTDKEKNA